MLLQLGYGIMGAAYYFRWFSLLVLALVVPAAHYGVQLTPPGRLGSDFVAHAAAAMALTGVALHTALCVWWRVESSLDCKPWARWQRAGADGGRAACPFARATAQPPHPARTCPDCGCVVSASAWHPQDRSVNWLVGDYFPLQALAWRAVDVDFFKQPETAGLLCKEEAWPEKVKADIDGAYALRGNFIFEGLPACCVGCATHRRCWHGLHHLIVISAAAGLGYALIPHILSKDMLSDPANQDDRVVRMILSDDFRKLMGTLALAMGVTTCCYALDGALTTAALFGKYPHLEREGGAPQALPPGRLGGMLRAIGATTIGQYLTRLPRTEADIKLKIVACAMPTQIVDSGVTVGAAAPPAAARPAVAVAAAPVSGCWNAIFRIQKAP